MGNPHVGWIKLHRTLLNSPIFKDAKALKLFIYLLLSANHEDKLFQNTIVKRGQIVTSRRQLAKNTGLSEQEVRSALITHCSTHCLTQYSTHRFSIITICNYDKYQGMIDQEQPTTQPTTQPTSQPQLKNIRIKEYKNKNIYTPEKSKFNPEGKIKLLDWVYLSKEQIIEVQKYYQRHGLTIQDFDEAVKALDGWFEDNPKMREKRTNDAKALKGWPLQAALKLKSCLLDVKRKESYLETKR